MSEPAGRAARAYGYVDRAVPDSTEKAPVTDNAIVWTEAMPLWNAVEDDADIVFYQRVARMAGRPLVELGIGYGRVASRLRPEYGVDNAPEVLAPCLRAAPDTAVLVASAEDYTLPEPAALTYAPQNLLSLLPDGGVPRLLATAFRNTRPGGLLALDAAVPQWDRIRRRGTAPVLHGQVGRLRMSVRAEPATSGELRMYQVFEWLDRDGRVAEQREYPPIPVRYVEPARVGSLLTGAGWQVTGNWGGFAGQPLTTGSTRQVWLARRPC
jgi:hypothetical protein